jgi:hypothetical protein
MNCVNCGSENHAVVMIESIPCSHCGGELRIEYNLCKECGMAWKAVDGEPLPESTFFDVGLDEIFDEEELLKDFGIIFKNSVDEEPNNMKDYIHNCLRCSIPCFETDENTWECPSCGFIWEVIKTRG